jgi:dTDP-3-amino-2,3,6-trideoxy-4-keto-D-glucose/dTDP-3-amino-3,4,6-trideoxy-alpha-D-glucose/dTDP-2,6-dideoxy-D-kanosamine transaminase
MKVRYSYLHDQFSNPDEILALIKDLVKTGDFTLGKPVREFEAKFAALIGAKHAVGVGSGTDAIKLLLRAADIGHGDEVITAANTFIATVGAIAETGATTKLVDCDDSFCMNAELIEAAITPRTKAIVPVSLTGNLPDLPKVMKIAEKYKLVVVEDVCQSILASYDGRRAGLWGIGGAFSLHPLKNLNVWGDGGIIVTNDDKVAERLRLLRNHGLIDRDTIAILGHNSRLDSLHAVVGNWLIPQCKDITEKRRRNAAYYDQELAAIRGIKIPPRKPEVEHAFHLYMVFADNRDALYQHCLDNGVEAKIHYPVPLYQQEGLKHLGYKAGDFPVSDRHARSIISFPADQHLEQAQLDIVVDVVRSFYAEREVAVA